MSDGPVQPVPANWSNVAPHNRIILILLRSTHNHTHVIRGASERGICKYHIASSWPRGFQPRHNAGGASLQNNCVDHIGRVGRAWCDLDFVCFL